MNWFQQKRTDVMGLDPRSLAVFRIGLGLTLIDDLLVRSMDVRAMYATGGILPMEDSVKMAGPLGWSLHWFSGDLWFQWLLWGVAMILAVGVLLGYRTWWMVVASFVLLASIHTRNPLILNGGDGMFRVLMFWAIFLPLGAVWSLDARRLKKKGRQPSLEPVVSVASFCLILQLCLIYWFAGTAKWNAVWLGFDPAAVWKDPSLLASANFGGEAMERAMNYDIYCKPLAGVLLYAPWLLRFICIGTLVLEILVPVLLFIPFRTQWLRMFVIASFILLHIGIELTLHVGLFTWIGLAAWAALLPPMFWESGWLKRLNPAPAIPTTGKPVMHSAWWLWGKFLATRAIPATACAVLIVVTLAWNFSYSMKKDVKSAVQRPIRPIVNATMLRQQWNMFSKPNLTESWFVYRAELHDGEVVDIFQRGRPVNMKKPADLSATFTNHRWRKLHVNLCSSRFKKYRRGVADYVARAWNDSHSDEQHIVRLELFQLREKKDAPRECINSLCLTIVPEKFNLAPDEDGTDATEPEVAATLR